MTPVEFLLARLDEAGAEASEAEQHGWAEFNIGLQAAYTAAWRAPDRQWHREQASRHIGRWHPAFVLADIAAKRAILELLTSWRHVVVEDCWYTCPAATSERDGGECCDDIRRAAGDCDCGRDHLIEQVVRRFCQPFADHPDYDQTWRP